MLRFPVLVISMGLVLCLYAQQIEQKDREVGKGAKLIIWGGHYEADYYANGAVYDLNKNRWTEMPQIDIEGRYGHKAILYGSKLLIWGGRGSITPYSDGAIYDMKANKWEDMLELPLDARFSPISIFQNKKLFIWGGTLLSPEKEPRDDGAIYDIEKQEWKEITEAPIEWRSGCSYILSQNMFIVWGGWEANEITNDGAIYYLEKNKWEEIPEAPIKGRVSAVFVLCGKKLVIWGGYRGKGNVCSDGAVYNIKTGKWKKMSRAPIKARTRAISLLSDTKLLIWGGMEGATGPRGGFFNDGAVYDVEKDRWEKLPKPPLRRIKKRYGMLSRTFGTKLIIWGGEVWRERPPRILYNDGAIYDLQKGVWEKIPKAPIRGRARRWYKEAVFEVMQGTEKGATKLIVWGGYRSVGTIYKGGFYNDGAIYDLGKRQWRKIKKAPISTSRYHLSPILWGGKLIVFGGEKHAEGPCLDGAIYDLDKNRWEKIPEAPIEERRRYTLLLWKGGKNE